MTADLKPEYLRNSAMKNVSLPSEISWKVAGHTGETSCLTFDRDGDRIFTGGADGLVKVWSTKDGKELAVMSGFKKGITDVSCSLDNEYVLAASLDSNKVTMFRTKTWRGLTNYIGHADTVNACRFNYSQKAVVTCSNDRTIRYWD